MVLKLNKYILIFTIMRYHDLLELVYDRWSSPLQQYSYCTLLDMVPWDLNIWITNPLLTPPLPPPPPQQTIKSHLPSVVEFVTIGPITGNTAIPFSCGLVEKNAIDPYWVEGKLHLFPGRGRRPWHRWMGSFCSLMNWSSSREAAAAPVHIS